MTDDLLQRLVDAERGAEPTVGASERVWTGIEHRLGHGPPPPELDAEPLLTGAGSGSAVLKIVGVVGLIGLVTLGAIAGSKRLDDRNRGDDRVASPAAAPATKPSEPATPALEPTEPAEPAEPTGPAESADSAVVDAPTEGVEPPAVIEPAPVKARPNADAQQPVTKPVTKPAEPKTLADELALMQRISAALKRDDAREVLALVAEHERDFASGQLVEERVAAKAQALCARGKLKAGLRELDRLERRWPSSIHLPAARQACDS